MQNIRILGKVWTTINNCSIPTQHIYKSLSRPIYEQEGRYEKVFR